MELYAISSEIFSSDTSLPVTSDSSHTIIFSKTDLIEEAIDLGCFLDDLRDTPINLTILSLNLSFSSPK